MKKVKAWLSEIFDVQSIDDISMDAVSEAFNDPGIRAMWLLHMQQELKNIHLEVDRRLLTSTDMGLQDLCARRKAYQDILQFVLSAKRIVTQEIRPNQPKRSVVDLDRVTA